MKVLFITREGFEKIDEVSDDLPPVIIVPMSEQIALPADFPLNRPSIFKKAFRYAGRCVDSRADYVYLEE